MMHWKTHLGEKYKIRVLYTKKYYIFSDGRARIIHGRVLDHIGQCRFGDLKTSAGSCDLND